MSDAPSFTRSEIEAALIEGHARYGGLIHQKAAEALAASLQSTPSDRATGHALFSRLFGEYAAALETHGAWAWALRNRFARGSFVDAYLGYSNQNVGSFYAYVRDHEGDLGDLLRLPSPERVIEAAGEAYPAEIVELGWQMRYARLKKTAEFYFVADRILIDTYNKTKHGAPMVRLVEPDNPRVFEFVVPEWSRSGDDRYRLAKFTVNQSMIDRLSNNVASMTTSISELATLTKLIHEVGLLYEEGPQG